MNNLEIFKNEEFGEVRTTVINDKPYVCLADVCKILELEQVSRVKSRLNQDGVTTSKVIDSLGREQEATFISESNLYKVIFQSRKPEAEKFTDWVTSEVLPAIRKTGEYKIPKTPLETLELMFQVQKENADKIEKLDTRVYEIEENSCLNPGEYNLINTKVSERIRNIKQELGLDKPTREQNTILYRAINSEIKTITGDRKTLIKF